MAEEAVAGILLAGGGSSRFGSDKLEERVKGVRLVDLACRNFLDAGLEPVVLVGGPLPEEHVLHMRPAHPTQHMIDTLRLGLRMIDGPFAFAPADMPALAPDLIRELLKVFQGSGRDYLVPSHAGRHGHPAFGRSPEPFLQAGADGGAREVFRAAGDALLVHEVSSADVLFDIDEPADLQAAANAAARRQRLIERGDLQE